MAVRLMLLLLPDLHHGLIVWNSVRIPLSHLCHVRRAFGAELVPIQRWDGIGFVDKLVACSMLFRPCFQG